MKQLLQILTLIAGLLLIALLGIVRETGRIDSGRRPRRGVEARVAILETAGGAMTPPAPPAAASRGLDAFLAAPFAPDPGIPSGPFSTEGPGETPDGLAELSLTPSQRTVVDALLVNRDAEHGEIRREVEARRPTGADADRLCSRAERAQTTCMTSIRDLLLPDQQARFDALVKSGRWGGYLLTIPR